MAVRGGIDAPYDRFRPVGRSRTSGPWRGLRRFRTGYRRPRAPSGASPRDDDAPRRGAAAPFRLAERLEAGPPCALWRVEPLAGCRYSRRGFVGCDGLAAGSVRRSVLGGQGRRRRAHPRRPSARCAAAARRTSNRWCAIPASSRSRPRPPSGGALRWSSRSPSIRPCSTGHRLDRGARPRSGVPWQTWPRPSTRCTAPVSCTVTCPRPTSSSSIGPGPNRHGRRSSTSGARSGSTRRRRVRARPGTRWGTPGSVAPEVVAGAPVGPAADRYGLGAVGLHWLDLAEPSASEAGGRERLTATCTALTAFEPTARPSDLAAVAALLREAAGPLEETDPPRPAAATSSPRVRTVEFGPRPERVVSPEVATTADHQVRRSLVVAAMVLVGSLIGVRATHHAPRRSTGLQRSAPSRSCAPGQGAGPLEPGRPRLVDLDGDGCARRVVWQPPRLAVARAPDPAGRSPVAPRRFRLGRAGDRLAIGALGCAARPELVLYRPSTGELFAYPSLPDPDRGTPVVHPEHRRSGVRNGRLSIDRGPDGCERLVVAGKATS